MTSGIFAHADDQLTTLAGPFSRGLEAGLFARFTCIFCSSSSSFAACAMELMLLMMKVEICRRG